MPAKTCPPSRRASGHPCGSILRRLLWCQSGRRESGSQDFDGAAVIDGHLQGEADFGDHDVLSHDVGVTAAVLEGQTQAWALGTGFRSICRDVLFIE